MAKKKSKNSGSKKSENSIKTTEKQTDQHTDQPNLEETPIVSNEAIEDPAETKNESLNEKVISASTEEDLNLLNNKVVDLETQLNELKSQLLEKDFRLEEISKQKDTEIEELNTKIQDISIEKQLNETDSIPIDNDEVESLKNQLALKIEESNKHKENYDKLFSRVSQMKNIFNKMKESEAKYELLENENKELRSQLELSNSKFVQIETAMSELNSECDRLTDMNSELKKQVESQDFQLENDTKSLEDENKKLKRELKETKSDLEEYLILIQEEKMSKTNLNQEISDLKIKLETIQNEKSTAEAKCKELTDKISKLNESLEQLKNENEDMISTVKLQLENKVNQLNIFTEEINDLKTLIAEKDSKLNTLQELENSLREKQLLIGKLRHETITLNEHLTKAMKLIKKESGKEMVDRELVSNLFISFLQIPRGDTKKFEVLQLLANFLDWDDDKKRHAGLLSSGNYQSKSNSVVEVPHPGRSGSQSSQSFVSLWTEFLEKESTPQEDAGTSK
jgi:hypothetical protein